VFLLSDGPKKNNNLRFTCLLRSALE